MQKSSFDKVLVANRGEIALRIMRTLKKMSIKSVAVYSEADTNSMHVQYADEAFYIGNSAATESYLSVPNIIDAVRRSGALAVHPGYGFLSENIKFAAALELEGVSLIGPSTQAIAKMGDKIEAKKIAVSAGVNTVPGYMGIIDNIEQAVEIAKAIGFPVIVKAAAGGGGRGMRVVKNADDMLVAFNSAKFEAENSFSDSRVFIEKFIESPRHIEIQLLADKFGNSICMGERECSIQRHHQKIIEEAPSIFITPEIRAIMYEQVIALAKKVNYYSAGTVEFIIDNDRNFYFLEMNTRLQVEHPVTELITGVDIVEEMINIAMNKPLLIKQEDIKLKGWAFEARICAEDPSRGFLPSSGRIIEYSEPLKDANIRIDTGICSGGEVSMFYDPMIAKLCVHHDTREQAIDLLRTALSSFVIRGISHNISFLEALVTNKRFIEGDINTSFIADVYPDGFLGSHLTSEITEAFLAASIYIYIEEQKRSSTITSQEQAKKIGTRWVVSIDNRLFPVLIKQINHGYKIRHEQGKLTIKSNWYLGNSLFSGIVNNRKINVGIEHVTTGFKLTHAGTSVKAYVRSIKVAELESLMIKDSLDHDFSELIAPLSGQIIKIKVKVGDRVIKGQDIMVLSAMKMENIITAEFEGEIASVHVSENDHVNTGQLLLEFK